MKNPFSQLLLWVKPLKNRAFAFTISAIFFSLIVPILSSEPTIAQASAEVQFVPPPWVVEHSKDPNLRILDVRTNPLDYIPGHIPNAVHIADNTFRGPNGTLPVQYWQLDKIKYLFTQAGITDESEVLVYADGREVLGATMVAYLLERTGHPKVAILDGGFAGYQAAKLPVTKEFPKYKPGKFTINPLLLFEDKKLIILS